MVHQVRTINETAWISIVKRPLKVVNREGLDCDQTGVLVFTCFKRIVLFPVFPVCAFTRTLDFVYSLISTCQILRKGGNA